MLRKENWIVVLKVFSIVLGSLLIALWIGDRLSYDPGVTMNIGIRDAKEFAGNRLIFRIGYTMYHKPRGLKKIPDGGIPWYIFDNEVKTYEFVPGESLKILDSYPNNEIPKNSIHTHFILGLRTAGVRNSRSTYITDQDISKYKDDFLRIDFIAGGTSNFSSYDFSYDKLEIPNPKDYYNNFKVMAKR